MAYIFRSGARGAGGGGAVMRRPQGRGLNAASKTPDVGSRFLPSHLPPEEKNLPTATNVVAGDQHRFLNVMIR